MQVLPGPLGGVVLDIDFTVVDGIGDSLFSVVNDIRMLMARLNILYAEGNDDITRECILNILTHLGEALGEVDNEGGLG